MNNFKNFKQKVNIPYALISCVLAIFLVVGITIAFFFDDDWASSSVQMSGKVDIEAVGNPDEDGKYSSIEDISSDDGKTSKLVIRLQDDYDVLIPNMEMYIYANCKVSQSTTSPLLRAKVEMRVVGSPTSGTTAENDQNAEVITDIYDRFSDVILEDADWVSYTSDDGTYFYYIGSKTQTATEVEDYLLQEIDVTSNDTVIHFIDKYILFPHYVTSSYSGLGIEIVITFQAIQNYIPDTAGNSKENTIENSLQLFKNLAPID